MIAKITRGGDAPRLVRYLFGPGNDNEHTDQRVVAADESLGVPVGRMLSKGEVRELAQSLDAPFGLYGTEVSQGYSWHLSLATKGGVDRELSDADWAAIAAEVVERMGFTEAPGRAPCRWVAIRHGASKEGNDHLHLAVNLVREDGSAARLGRDYVTVSKLCADMEARFGLYVVEGRSRGGMRGLTKADLERAERGGRSEPERRELARRVRAAAVASGGEAEFVRRLRASGVAVRPRYAPCRSGVGGGEGRRRVSGFAVAVEAPEGQQFLWYSGGKLAKDLSLPALRAGWSETEAERSDALVEWGSAPHAGRGSEGRHRRSSSWEETAAEWGPGRSTSDTGGPEQARYAPDAWDEAARRMAGVVATLAAVPADDRAAWEAAANHAAGVLGSLSARLEAPPGPLAAAADVLARSAQAPRGESRPAGGRVVTGAMRSVAAVMAQAQITDETAAAWGLVLAELLRVAQAIHQAHLARGEAVQAQRLATEARASLEQARTSLGTTSAAAAQLAEILRRERDMTSNTEERDGDGREGRHRRKDPAPTMRPTEYAALAARRAVAGRAQKSRDLRR